MMIYSFLMGQSYEIPIVGCFFGGFKLNYKLHFATDEVLGSVGSVDLES